jgi:hypothetical protein
MAGRRDGERGAIPAADGVEQAEPGRPSGAVAAGGARDASCATVVGWFAEGPHPVRGAGATA